MRLFVDGIEAGSGSRIADFTTETDIAYRSNGELLVGSFLPNGFLGWTGDIDEVRISAGVTAVPEPGVLALLVGSVVLLRRRR